MLGVIRWRLCALAAVGMAVLSVPVVATARGGGGGGAGSYGNASKQPDGCKFPLGVQTSKRKHQPFEEYDGTISTPGGQPYPNSQDWSLIIDRCHSKTPKIAAIGAVFPGYYCGSTEVYEIYVTDAWFGANFGPKEPRISHNKFSFTFTDRQFQTYTMTGTISGNVKIPKRGPAKGKSTITGTVVPALCPGLRFAYKIKFTRSWSTLIRGTPA